MPDVAQAPLAARGTEKRDFIPRPTCSTCYSQMWLIMMPMRRGDDKKVEWLFRCPACNTNEVITEP